MSYIQYNGKVKFVLINLTLCVGIYGISSDGMMMYHAYSMRGMLWRVKFLYLLPGILENTRRISRSSLLVKSTRKRIAARFCSCWIG